MASVAAVATVRSVNIPALRPTNGNRCSKTTLAPAMATPLESSTRPRKAAAFASPISIVNGGAIFAKTMVSGTFTALPRRTRGETESYGGRFGIAKRPSLSALVFPSFLGALYIPMSISAPGASFASANRICPAKVTAFNRAMSGNE